MGQRHVPLHPAAFNKTNFYLSIYLGRKILHYKTAMK
ncbi:rCG33178 [Rattus norvegicus]|uniref:RCG33178 n=1 Tax=Rattus norvegicus TaxID=10116 RepID=A6HH97_RAT|nr:rCG33178 [Rattus norvegicus]